MEELHDFVCLHGAGFPACTNDSSLAAPTSYIHQVVISKIRIGVPKDKPVHVPCGFSALRSGTQSSCPPNAMTSDPNIVSMSRQNPDPVGHPGVSGASTKQTMSFDILSHACSIQAGTLHAFIMKLWSQRAPKP